MTVDPALRHLNLGAYGFRLVPHGPGLEMQDLVEQGAHAPAVAVSCSGDAAETSFQRVRPDSCEISNRGGLYMSVTKDPPAIILRYPGVTAAAFVHPIATVPLSFLAHWLGYATLHAGAFLYQGKAWVVVGDRGAGKSTLLALLGQRGHPVVADDLVVIDGDEVLSGPSCVDLREDAAGMIPGTRAIGKVGDRMRHRLATPPAPPRVPLGGIWLLDWGEETVLEPLSLDVSVKLLHEQHCVGPLGPPEPAAVFALLGKPMRRFRRPRAWVAADAAIDQLLEAIDAL
jgi:hypothetical protein